MGLFQRVLSNAVAKAFYDAGTQRLKADDRNRCKGVGACSDLITVPTKHDLQPLVAHVSDE